MEKDNVCKMVLIGRSNGLDSVKCCSIMVKITASTHDMGTKMYNSHLVVFY